MSSCARLFNTQCHLCTAVSAISCGPCCCVDPFLCGCQTRSRLRPLINIACQLQHRPCRLMSAPDVDRSHLALPFPCRQQSKACIDTWPQHQDALHGADCHKQTLCMRRSHPEIGPADKLEMATLPEERPSAAAMLHEAAGAAQEHLLAELNLRTLMALSRTCRAWHHLIATCPFSQLLPSIQHQLLPSGLSAQEPFRDVLQQRADLVARLRGKKPLNHHLQQLAYTGRSMWGLSWSPQSDLSQPSRWLRVLELQHTKLGASPCSGSSWA